LLLNKNEIEIDNLDCYNPIFYRLNEHIKIEKIEHYEPEVTVDVLLVDCKPSYGSVTKLKRGIKQNVPYELKRKMFDNYLLDRD